MATLNADIARIFEEIADLLEIRDENPFSGTERVTSVVLDEKE